MRSTIRSSAFATLITLLLGGGAALAQEGGGVAPAAGTERSTPPAAPPEKRVGDAYPFATCPVSGKALGAMGAPAVRVYRGREVRFCCAACVPTFEKDVSAGLAALDAKIIEDQRPLYPLSTSLVTGKALPAIPHEFVYGNRLVRLGAKREEVAFLKDTAKHFGALDAAVVRAQGPGYALTTCPVSGDAFGGEMGEPEDLVVAGRLVRLCCAGCEGTVEKDPAKFVALVDAARKGAAGTGGADRAGEGRTGGDGK